MRRTAFASLCSVTKQQVSKYERAGLLVFSAPDQVDAAASLAAMEGRLDEEKRRRALAVLGDATAGPQPTSSRPARTPQGAKAQKDEIELALKTIELGQATGALVLAADVDAAARDAISLMRESLHNGKRELAARICAAFGLPADRAGALARMIGDDFERALGRFARAATALARPDRLAEGEPPADAAPSPPGVAPAGLAASALL